MIKPPEEMLLNKPSMGECQTPMHDELILEGDQFIDDDNVKIFFLHI